MVGHADGIVAILPLKALAQAKSRLAPALGDRARRELVAWMLARVVAACRASALVSELLVVAGDEAAAVLARSLGTGVLVEPAPGLAAAMAAADRATASAPATLTVAADLPLARGEDLDAVCRAVTAARAVVVAPTRDGGTAALLRRPAGVIVPGYGPGSASAHLRAARRAGVTAVRLDVERLAHDVDTAEQLRATLTLAGARNRLASG